MQTSEQKRQYKKQWQEANKERLRIYRKNWRDTHKEHIRNQAKVYRQSPKGQLQQQRAALKHPYRPGRSRHVLPEEFNILFEKQKGVCAICSLPCRVKKRLSIDHNHSTQRTRGLLCLHCNSGLGYFKDSIELLQKAQAYLQHHN